MVSHDCFLMRHNGRNDNLRTHANPPIGIQTRAHWSVFFSGIVRYMRNRRLAASGASLRSHRGRSPFRKDRGSVRTPCVLRLQGQARRKLVLPFTVHRSEQGCARLLGGWQVGRWSDPPTHRAAPIRPCWRKIKRVEALLTNPAVMYPGKMRLCISAAACG